LGDIDDGYVGSNKRFKCAHISRPNTFRRRILEWYQNISHKDLLQREQIWLNKIKPEELNCVKYYNEKKMATGGDIISTLPVDRKIQHSIKSGLASKKYWTNITDEELQIRKKTAFGGNTFDRSYMKLRNKNLCSRTAEIYTPDGVKCIVTNISEFCQINNLNYGNMKTVLRGNRKSCKGFTGKYL